MFFEIFGHSMRIALSMFAVMVIHVVSYVVPKVMVVVMMWMAARN